MELKKYNNINFKYLVLGCLFGICLMLVIAASNGRTGKYQCCPAGDNDQAVYVIDTKTGHAWRMSRIDTLDFGTPQERKSERRSQTPITR